jgi:hypothetical protein
MADGPPTYCFVVLLSVLEFWLNGPRAIVSGEEARPSGIPTCQPATDLKQINKTFPTAATWHVHRCYWLDTQVGWAEKNN